MKVYQCRDVHAKQLFLRRIKCILLFVDVIWNSLNAKKSEKSWQSGYAPDKSFDCSLFSKKIVGEHPALGVPVTLHEMFVSLSGA